MKSLFYRFVGFSLKIISAIYGVVMTYHLGLGCEVYSKQAGFLFTLLLGLMILFVGIFVPAVVAFRIGEAFQEKGNQI